MIGLGTEAILGAQAHIKIGADVARKCRSSTKFFLSKAHWGD